MPFQGEFNGVYVVRTFVSLPRKLDPGVFYDIGENVYHYLNKYGKNAAISKTALDLPPEVFSDPIGDVTPGIGGIAVPSHTYGPDWDGNLSAPTKDDVYDQIESIIAGTINDLHYTHDQGVPSSVWTIPHLLGKNPTAAVVDTSGKAVVGYIKYIDLNNIIITFNSSFAGQAYLN